jgi:hypothetical protein
MYVMDSSRFLAVQARWYASATLSSCSVIVSSSFGVSAGTDTGPLANGTVRGRISAVTEVLLDRGRPGRHLAAAGSARERVRGPQPAGGSAGLTRFLDNRLFDRFGLPPHM